MSTYQNGPGNVPRLPDCVVDCLIDAAGVSRCAPGRTVITVRDQTANVEQLVHDACEELLARLPTAATPATPRQSVFVDAGFRRALNDLIGSHEVNEALTINLIVAIDAWGARDANGEAVRSPA